MTDERRGTVTLSVRCRDEFAEDVRLLRAARPAVRVSVLGEVAVSFGVGVPAAAPYLGRAESAGIPTVRRTTGGTGVLHLVGDLAWSVVLPRRHPVVGTDFVRAYGRIGAGLVRWLAAHGVDAAWVPAPGVNPDYCVLSGRGEVLVARDRVLGGAAQQLTRSALLHQGMIAGRVDRALVARLFSIESPSTLSRLVGLDELGVAVDPRDAARGLAGELSREFLSTEP